MTHLIIAVVLAAVILVAGFRLSLIVPRWVRHDHRSLVMVSIWILSLGIAVPVAAVIG